MQTEQIQRIQRMEQNLDEAARAVACLSDALEGYAMVQAKLAELFAYYGGEDWWKDYNADDAGLLPQNLKRGVLSQDAVYDLLTEHDRLLAIMRELIGLKDPR